MLPMCVVGAAAAGMSLCGWCADECVRLWCASFVCVCVVVVGGARIASGLSELRSCVVCVVCSVISATVSKMRPPKWRVFSSSGRVL